MRATVIMSDIVILVPAIWLFISAYYKGRKYHEIIATFFFILVQPGLILIDHGHFQYNGVSIGLAILGIALILKDNDMLGSFFFALSLNFKQMSLYYSPAFFFYLLGKNIDRKRLGYSLFRIILIGLVVIGTFVLCWLPFLFNIDNAIVVLNRLFPVHRGLYEDKVANFWCSISPVLKIKNLLDVQQVLKLCTTATLLAFIPSCLITLVKPTKKNFILCLSISSFSFFFFSYHTHEKSILLPISVLSLLVLEHPHIVTWTSVISCFSMYPLLYRDGQGIPYVVLTLLYLLASKNHFKGRVRSGLSVAIILMVVLHMLEKFVDPPTRYPDIFTLAITSFSFINFFLAFIVIYSTHFEGIAKKISGIKED